MSFTLSYTTFTVILSNLPGDLSLLLEEKTSMELHTSLPRLSCSSPGRNFKGLSGRPDEGVDTGDSTSTMYPFLLMKSLVCLTNTLLAMISWSCHIRRSMVNMFVLQCKLMKSIKMRFLVRGTSMMKVSS